MPGLRCCPRQGCISIHAPREGSDGRGRPGRPDRPISIHAPREGSDANIKSKGSNRREFLSTLPARGATQHLAADQRVLHISIHAPREGSDPAGRRSPRRWRYFYPRSPRGERRAVYLSPPRKRHFYPRSPRGERRASRLYYTGGINYFYPRSPRGERRAP